MKSAFTEPRASSGSPSGWRPASARCYFVVVRRRSFSDLANGSSRPRRESKGRPRGRGWRRSTGAGPRSSCRAQPQTVSCGGASGSDRARPGGEPSRLDGGTRGLALTAWISRRPSVIANRLPGAACPALGLAAARTGSAAPARCERSRRSGAGRSVAGVGGVARPTSAARALRVRVERVEPEASRTGHRAACRHVAQTRSRQRPDRRCRRESVRDDPSPGLRRGSARSRVRPRCSRRAARAGSSSSAARRCGRSRSPEVSPRLAIPGPDPALPGGGDLGLDVAVVPGVPVVLRRAPGPSLVTGADVCP